MAEEERMTPEFYGRYLRCVKEWILLIPILG